MPPGKITATVTARVAAATRTNVDVAVNLAVVAITPVVADATAVARVVVRDRATVDFAIVTGDADAELTSRAWSTEPCVACWMVITRTIGMISHRDRRSHRPLTLTTRFTDHVISC